MRTSNPGEQVYKRSGTLPPNDHQLSLKSRQHRYGRSWVLRRQNSNSWGRAWRAWSLSKMKKLQRRLEIRKGMRCKMIGMFLILSVHQGQRWEPFAKSQTSHVPIFHTVSQCWRTLSAFSLKTTSTSILLEGLQPWHANVKPRRASVQEEWDSAAKRSSVELEEQTASLRQKLGVEETEQQQLRESLKSLELVKDEETSKTLGWDRGGWWDGDYAASGVVALDGDMRCQFFSSFNWRHFGVFPELHMQYFILRQNLYEVQYSCNMYTVHVNLYWTNNINCRWILEFLNESSTFAELWQSWTFDGFHAATMGTLNDHKKQTDGERPTITKDKALLCCF